MYFLSQTYRQFYPNTYTYQYDANGNMVLDSIGRVMKDGHLEENISKRQLLWDEENRLLAINDNGYVSSYLYNANGDRTVKLSGNNEAVYVNTIPSANETQTDRFTIYPSPYMVFTNGGRYTKHIYIGSERIVSKVAIDNGYDPRTTPTAAYGNNIYVTRLNNKSTALNDSIEAIYTKFQLPFNGLNNDDIIQGFQPSLMNRAYTMSTGIDNYEEYSYYIHSDHLGSTSYITNSDGEVSQHVEYVPFGEVFIEELSSSAKLNPPYLFNGKEFDEETGLYYYGARYYDPRISLWLSTDPMELKYPNISTYTYCANNPIKRKELDGQDWIEQGNCYFYDVFARDQDYVTEHYGNGAKYLFKAGKLYSTDGRYSYDLAVGGHVINSFTGEYIPGTTITDAGSIIHNDNAYFQPKEMSFVEQWANSDNILAILSYQMVNDLYIGIQAFDFGILDRPEWENPFTGASFGNLDGTPNYNQVESLPGIVSTIVPFSQASKGIPLIKKLNAADFSRLFKGNLSKLKPNQRGMINRTINNGIESVNTNVGSGKIVLDGVDVINTKSENK